MAGKLTAGSLTMSGYKTVISHRINAVYRLVSLSQPSSLRSRSGVPDLAARPRSSTRAFRPRGIQPYLLKVAAVDSHVLVTGETGTGKELTVRFVDRLSARHDKPRVTINVAALPDGLGESELFGYEKGAFTGTHATYAGKCLTDRGAVFSDEIGDSPIPYSAAITCQ